MDIETKEKIKGLKHAEKEDSAEFTEIMKQGKLQGMEIKPETQLNYLLQLLENNAVYSSELRGITEKYGDDEEKWGELNEELYEARQILRGYIKRNWVKTTPVSRLKSEGLSGC